MSEEQSNKRPRLILSEIKRLIHNFERAQYGFKKSEEYLRYRIERLKGRQQQNPQIEDQLSMSEEKVERAHIFLAEAIEEFELAKNELIKLGIEFD
ncbi:MAG: hypothetical protein WC823_03540 [Parcubacteria group bacterium]